MEAISLSSNAINKIKFKINIYILNHYYLLNILIYFTIFNDHAYLVNLGIDIYIFTKFNSFGQLLFISLTCQLLMSLKCHNFNLNILNY